MDENAIDAFFDLLKNKQMPDDNIVRISLGLLRAAITVAQDTPRGKSTCGCNCTCHTEEDIDSWPGPCAVCCEPGMNCDCGRALAYLNVPEEIWNLRDCLNSAIKIPVGDEYQLEKAEWLKALRLFDKSIAIKLVEHKNENH